MYVAFISGSHTSRGRATPENRDQAMIRKTAGILIAAGALAGTAAAQETDPFCEGLETVVAAADAAIPFGSLSPNLAAGQSMGKAQIAVGFDDARSCNGYLAGTLEKGTVGGGPYNYVKCQYFYENRNSNEKAVEEASRVLSGLTERIAACAADRGWTESTPWPFKPNVRLKGKRYLVPGGEVDIVAYSESRSSGRRGGPVNTYYEVHLQVRTQNPNHPYERVD